VPSDNSGSVSFGYIEYFYTSITLAMSDDGMLECC